MGKSEQKIKKLPKYSDERGREYFFDNAKFLLILLVVLAHFIAPLKENHDTAKAIWILINSFHMPCFIFMSGFFAKSYIKKDGEIKYQRPFTYIMYYLFAQLVMSLFEYFVLGTKGMNKSVFLPRQGLWYLLCMIMWYILLPYVSKMKISVVLGCGFVFGLLVGYDTKVGRFLSICRAVTHFPFFMLGYYFQKDWLYKFRNKWTQLISAVTIIGILAFAYLKFDIIAPRILECSYNYKETKLILFNKLPIMWINRFIYYIVALILCASFLLLTPRTKLFFTRFGSRTLQVYILHRFLYFCETEYELHKLPFFDTFGVYKMMLIAVIVTFILSLKIFEYPFNWIAKIKIDPLLKNENKT